MPTIEQARTWYIHADSVHNFDHVLRVYQMAEKLARIEGGDFTILRAASLLHDAEGSAPDGPNRPNHHLQSADFAVQILAAEGWRDEDIAAVQHCIRAHRFRSGGEAPQTIEAKILFDADKLDVLGAIGIARVLAYAALSGNPFYSTPSNRFLTSGEKEPGELHSAYHEYLFKLRHIKERLFTPTARQLAEQRDAFLAGYFQQLADEIGNRS